MTDRIIVVENDINRRMKINRVFEKSAENELELEFLSCVEAAGVPYEYHDYKLAIIDFDPDPQGALIVAKLVRSLKHGMEIVALATPGQGAVTDEINQMGIEPVADDYASGVDALPGTVYGIVKNMSRKSGHKKANADLRKRNRELREITDALARQSVHLLRLRNELSAEKTKLETVINGVADGMVFFGVDGALQVINPVASKLVPATVEVYSLDYERFMALVEAAPVKNDRNKSSDYEVFEAEKNGRIYRIRVARPHDVNGVTAGVLVLMTDITREKEYERLKDDFSSMISHELRTPLTSIRAAVDNLLRGNLGEVNEDQRRFLELIIRNMERQETLIDDLLDLARLETGQVKLIAKPADLCELTRLGAEQFSLAFRDKGVALETSLGDNMPLIMADPHLVTQLLNNLLSNALKFTDEAGRVTLTVERIDAGDSGHVRISVCDTGIGIEKNQQDVIFDKYAQVDSSIRRRYSGAGLGLAICKEIMSAHGGTITLTSEPGHGACFMADFPITINQR